MTMPNPRVPLAFTPSRAQRKSPEDSLAFLGALRLMRGRVHEICGPARHSLAAKVLATSPGPALWAEFSGPTLERIHPPGLATFTDPGRVIFIRPRKAEDLLWAMEEGLRSGAVSLVIGALAAPPSLTAIRRLHLAAEKGAAAPEGGPAPTGLLLLPGLGGAAGVESRWHIAPLPSHGPHLSGSDLGPWPAGRRWHLTLTRARGQIRPQAWEMAVTAEGAWQALPWARAGSLGGGEKSSSEKF